MTEKSRICYEKAMSFGSVKIQCFHKSVGGTHKATNVSAWLDTQPTHREADYQTLKQLYRLVLEDPRIVNAQWTKHWVSFNFVEELDPNSIQQFIEQSMITAKLAI